jgi:hypothetical protein
LNVALALVAANASLSTVDNLTQLASRPLRFEAAVELASGGCHVLYLLWG